MAFEYRDTNLQSSDGQIELLRKILLRLNWNAQGQIDAPSSNVAVTNWDNIKADLTAINANTDFLFTILTRSTSIDTKLTTTNALLTTIDADTGHLPAIDVNISTLLDTSEDTRDSAASIDLKLTTSNAYLTNIESSTASTAARLLDGGSSAAQLLTSIKGDTTALAVGVHIKDPITGDRAHVTGDGHISVVSTPLGFEVAHAGTYGEKAAKAFKILGRRAGFNSTSVLQDIGEFLGTSTDLFPVLAGTEALEVVSSSVNDVAPGGSGTRSIRIVYLDTSYAIQYIDVNLNGTTPVGLGPIRMLHVYWMEALTGGASEISAGNIDLRTVAGAVVQERISAAGNKSLSARFMVPDGWTAYVTHYSASSVGTTNDIRLRGQVSTYDRALNDRFLFQHTVYLGNSQSLSSDLPFFKFPARARIKASTYPGATPAINRVDYNFVVYIVQD